MALQRVSIPSPCYSSRGGSGITKVIVHTAEGARTYQDLGRYFQNASVQASSHTGIDDTPGVCGEYVPRSMKAWTQANANPYCVSTELCAFASWGAVEWNAHEQMLRNCGAWIAEECAALGIPIVRLNAAQAQNPSVRGVCGHNELGAAGGGHWDPGPAFPWERVLAYASGGQPTTPIEEDDMAKIITCPINTGDKAQFLSTGVHFRWLTSSADTNFQLQAGHTPGGEVPNPVPLGAPVNERTAQLCSMPWPYK